MRHLLSNYRGALLFIGFLILLFILVLALKKPTNDKDWQEQNKVLPTAEFNGDIVTIKNIRNFTWKSETDFIPGYVDEVYDLSKIKKVWFFVSHFSRWSGAAHTMLSFEFDDGKFVNISVEARKAKGESYSFLSGLTRKYTLTYIVSKESDSVFLRTDIWKEKVYMYPIKASQDKARVLFTDMLKRANALAENPEFYNTFASSCTTNIVDHVNKISPKKIPLSYKYFFPGYSDSLAYEIGLIDTSLSLEEARKKYELPTNIEFLMSPSNFSETLREIIK